MRITFFVDSVVGYVDNPTAIYTRGLAYGLSLRGNDVRIVEPRQNAAVTQTLRAVGSEAARHFHDNFRTIQHHTFEPRRGAQLLEWITREVALIDVAVAVAGVDEELCRWLANLTRDDLVRSFLTFDPAALTGDAVAALELEKLDLVLATGEPTASIEWQEVAAAIATHDAPLLGAAGIDPDRADSADPIRAAEVFEAIVTRSTVLP